MRVRSRIAREGAPGPLSPESATDLMELQGWIAPEPSREVAMADIERAEASWGRPSAGSERGHRRDDVRPGLRILGFERRSDIAFTVDDELVTALRVFTAGKNGEAALSSPDGLGAPTKRARAPTVGVVPPR